MKIALTFFLVLFLVVPSSTFAEAGKLRVGLILDKGGRDDKSFNAAAFKGATEAQKKFNIELKVVESSDDSSIEPSLRTFAQRGYDLIMGIGFVMGDPMKKVSKEFPNIKFLLVDSEVKAPNVRAVVFNEHEGSFLVGAIAALASKTNAVGFVGGMDIPLIRRFELGYRSGAQHVNPKVTVVSNYVGSGSDAWRNPMKGKELAISQFNKKADVIFAAAGASGLGVFDAAEELKKYVIGVDSNQNWVKPGRVLTSMVKRIDLAVLESIEQVTKNKFEAGVFAKGLAEGAIDYSIDEHNRAILTPEIEKKANEIKAKILKKQIKVPDFYQTQGAKSAALSR